MAIILQKPAQEETVDLVIFDDKHAAAGEGLERTVLSLATGAGVSELQSELEARVVAALGGGEAPLATRIRHGESLREAHDRLSRSLEELEPAVELAAEDVRLAARALARVTGRIGAEDILDVVFSSFCIGK